MKVREIAELAKRMKKIYVKKVNSTMIEQLVNFENYKINALSQMVEFVNKLKITNKEEAIEEYKKMLQEEEQEIVLGGEFKEYILTYDDSDNTICFKNELDDTFCFGVKVENLDSDDVFAYVDIAVAINDHIEVYFKDENIEDCGEYWEIKQSNKQQVKEEKKEKQISPEAQEKINYIGKLINEAKDGVIDFIDDLGERLRNTTPSDDNEEPFMYWEEIKPLEDLCDELEIEVPFTCDVYERVDFSYGVEYDGDILFINTDIELVIGFLQGWVHSCVNSVIQQAQERIGNLLEYGC